MKALAEQISDIDGVNIYGRVVGVRGLMVEIAGPIHAMSVGARIVIETGGNRFIPSEVIGFTGNNAVVMRSPALKVSGAVVAQSSPTPQARCGFAIVARSGLNAMAADRRQGALPHGPSPMPYRKFPAAGAFAQTRRRAARSRRAALNTFLTCCRGRRHCRLRRGSRSCCRCWRALDADIERARRRVCANAPAAGNCDRASATDRAAKALAVDRLAHRIEDPTEPQWRRPHLACGVGDDCATTAPDTFKAGERHHHGIVAGEAITSDGMKRLPPVSITMRAPTDIA